MSDNRNTILAVILSGLVLIAWQYWYNIPQMEKQRAAQQAQQQTGPAAPGTTPGTTPPAATTPAGARAEADGADDARRHDCAAQSRESAIAASPG